MYDAFAFPGHVGSFCKWSRNRGSFYELPSGVLVLFSGIGGL